MGNHMPCRITQCYLPRATRAAVTLPPLPPAEAGTRFAVGDRFYRATACNATHGIAVAILSVCLSVRPFVRLFVRRVYCDKTKRWTADILIPHDAAITLVF